MSLIIFTLALLMIIIIYYYHLIRQYYVEQSIYELRQSKHDITMFMATNAIKLDDREYKDLKGLLKMVNDTIDLFAKIDGMRFSTIKIIINNTISSSIKIDRERSEFFKKHENVLKHYVLGIQTSLKAIPLLKLRIIVHLIKVILRLLVLVGLKRSKTYLRRFELFIVAEHTYFGDHCIN